MRKARRRILKVKPWPNLKKDILYQGMVRRVEVNKEHARLEVTIENLEPDQAGRLHEFALSLPVHPGNPASRFLIACGKGADAIGGEVCIDDIEGTQVAMRFSSTEAGDTQSVRFEEACPSSAQPPEQLHPEEPPSTPDRSSCRKDFP